METLPANCYTNTRGLPVLIVIAADVKKMLEKGGSLLHLLVIRLHLKHTIVMKS